MSIRFIFFKLNFKYYTNISYKKDAKPNFKHKIANKLVKNLGNL